MRKFTILKRERNIIISYGISDLKQDIHIITSISKICVANHLNFLIGEDDFYKRYFHIYGDGKKLQKCYDEIFRTFC